MHPRNNKNKNFDITDTIGANSLFVCCGVPKTPNKLAKEIGIGASMFLMSTKALTVLFLCLTILNIPIFMFYYNSNPMTLEDPNLRDWFGSINLGNIGSS